MDNRAAVREFLTSRRAKISPEQAGLPSTGRRRVPGLRRSEVAQLAGMSVEYYAQLERGALAGVSAGVLDSVARALQLDDAERAHLLRLAHEADGSSRIVRRPSAPQWSVRPALQWVLDSITSPAAVGNDRLDLLATNHLGRAMYADMLLDPASPPNFARYTFLDHSARRFYPNWDVAADMTVANLRTAAGKDPHDKRLHELVGELSTRSEEFRRRWNAHDVRTHGAGIKYFRHHIAGDLELSYETMDLRAEPGLALTVYSAAPGSPTAQALALLASWAATEQQADRQPHGR
ncbi:helix-turn-helix transcriptional regulator [Microlunatus ginsengisoli]|uniref:Helix-turn-helix transcriptional regulator n=1 Tax=Microlunatus ginsengisoli TaxID=363863 RepID=A0ABP6ZLR8_9ACTN